MVFNRQKPFSTAGFFLFILDLMKDMGIPMSFEYISASSYNAKKIRCSEFDCTFSIVPGSCEGIYAEFYLLGNIEGGNTADKYLIGSVKTLGENLEAYKKLADFACDFVYTAKEYVSHHMNDFDFEGYTARFDAEGYPEDSALFSCKDLDYVRDKAKAWLKNTKTGATEVKIYSYETRSLVETIAREEVAS